MAFGYHAAVLIFSFRDFESSCANNVMMENRPSSAGVERKIALSDHWRWVSTPKCARTSSNVTSTCQRRTNHARMSCGRASRSVARNACGSSSPLGSRTRSQRIGTGATPPRYQSAIPLVISTMRLVRPYHRLMRQRCQRTFGSLRMVESFLSFLPLIAGRPRPLRFGGGKANKVGVKPQSGDDAYVLTHCG